MPAPVQLQVRCEPLTAEAFAPFGQLIAAGVGNAVSANQGNALRTNWAAQFDHSRVHAKPNLAVFRSAARTLPLQLKLFERHPCSTQAFLPLIVGRMLVCVAPDLPDGSPDLARARAFVALPGQGINYRRGVWHHPIVALDSDADLAMLAWEDGTPLDCQEHWLPQPIDVVAE